MDSDGPHVSDELLIEADLGENGGRVEFASVEEARDWVEGEIGAWKRFQSNLLQSSFSASEHRIEKHVLEHVMERQLWLPKKILDYIAAVSPIQSDDPPGILQRIQDLFQWYADNHSVCSRSKVGRELTAVLPGPGPLMAVGQLAGILGIPVEETARHLAPNPSRHPDGYRFVGVWSGYVKGMMPDAVRRSDFEAHRSRLDVEIEKFRSIVEEAQRRETELKELCDSAKSEWASVKNTFEEQMRLQAPATY